MRKPSIEEIKAHIEQIGANIDAEKFYWHYESVGWMVGKNPMKSWKAAVQTWIRNQKQYNNGRSNERPITAAKFSDTRY